MHYSLCHDALGLIGTTPHSNIDEVAFRYICCCLYFELIHIWQKSHDDVIKWKHFPRYWPFVQGIHRPPVNSLHKGQWRGALMFSLICAWMNGWVNNREAGDLKRHHAHYDVTVMYWKQSLSPSRALVTKVFSVEIQIWWKSHFL